MKADMQYRPSPSWQERCLDRVAGFLVGVVFGVDRVWAKLTTVDDALVDLGGED